MKTLLYVSLLTALLSGCKKEDGPKINTGDFLLDGVRFVPQASVIYPGTGVGAYKDDNSVQIHMYRQEGNRIRMFNLFLAGIHKPGVYALQDSVSPSVVPGPQSFAVYSIPAIEKQYLTGPSSPGRVEITRFDTVAHIIAGTFEAQLREYQGPVTLRVTQGSFYCSF